MRYSVGKQPFVYVCAIYIDAGFHALFFGLLMLPLSCVHAHVAVALKLIMLTIPASLACIELNICSSLLWEGVIPVTMFCVYVESCTKTWLLTESSGLSSF